MRRSARELLIEDETQIGEGATVEDDSKIGEGAEVEDGKVVTLGENLSEEQRASMYEYFGTSAATRWRLLL